MSEVTVPIIPSQRLMSAGEKEHLQAWIAGNMYVCEDQDYPMTYRNSPTMVLYSYDSSGNQFASSLKVEDIFHAEHISAQLGLQNLNFYYEYYEGDIDDY